MVASMRAAALLLTLLTSSMAWAQANLIADGDMEAADVAGWSAWRVGGSFAKSSDDAYNGSQSMRIDNGGALAGFLQAGLPVEGGRTYKLRVAYRRVSGTFGVRVGIGTNTTDFQGLQFQTSSSPDAWGFHTRVFTLPEVLAGTVRVVVYGTGEAYVDDVTLAEHTAIEDGDMEADGTAAWLTYGGGNYTKQSDVVFNGSQAMAVNAGGFQQRFLPVEAGGKYRLSVRHKRDSGTLAVRMGLNTSNADSFGGGLSTSSGTDWALHTRVVTMPANIVGDVRLVVRCTGVCYIDDVKLEPLELLADWNAEAPGVGAWTKYTAVLGLLEKVVADVFAGARSLHLAQGGVQQLGIKVQAGATYNLSLWYKNNSGRFRVRLGANASNYDFAGQEFSTAVVGGWTQYTRQFTVPANFTGTFRLVLISDRGGDVLVDNTSITPQ